MAEKVTAKEQRRDFLAVAVLEEETMRSAKIMKERRVSPMDTVESQHQVCGLIVRR